MYFIPDHFSIRSLDCFSLCSECQVKCIPKLICCVCCPRLSKAGALNRQSVAEHVLRLYSVVEEREIACFGCVC
jgi:hypothetical protein